MENVSSPFFFCAVHPKDRNAAKQQGFIPFWMCYRMGDGPCLYRCAPPEQIQGGVLAADDSSLNRWKNPSSFYRQVIRECRSRQAEGFFANWSRKPSEARCRLLSGLEAALTQEGYTLYITESYGAACQHSPVLISTAISGGTLCQRMEDAIHRYGRERVVMAFERLSEDFPLPCPDGRGRSLSPAQLNELKESYSPCIHTSQELCARYFTYQRSEKTHLVLFDDKNIFCQKKKLSQELDLVGFLCAWEEIRDFL